MRSLKIFGLIFALSTVAVSSVACAGCDMGIQKYDGLVDADEKCNETWSNIESNLQRRSDMIPQLVATVQASSKHEENTLNEVIIARASATRPEIHLDANNDDFSDPQKFAAFQQAQSSLSGALSRLLVANENYPDLKANKAFSDLQVQIEGTENRLLRAREDYNKAVANYNKELRHVSGKVINPITGNEFKVRVYFQSEKNAQAAPVINFDNSPTTKDKK